MDDELSIGPPDSEETSLESAEGPSRNSSCSESGERARDIQRPPLEWNEADVMAWLVELGMSNHVRDVLHREEISTGKVLLSLDNAALLELDIPVGPRALLRQELDILRERQHDAAVEPPQYMDVVDSNHPSPEDVVVHDVGVTPPPLPPLVPNYDDIGPFNLLPWVPLDFAPTGPHHGSRTYFESMIMQELAGWYAAIMAIVGIVAIVLRIYDCVHPWPKFYNLLTGISMILMAIEQFVFSWHGQQCLEYAFLRRRLLENNIWKRFITVTKLSTLALLLESAAGIFGVWKWNSIMGDTHCGKMATAIPFLFLLGFFCLAPFLHDHQRTHRIRTRLTAEQAAADITEDEEPEESGPAPGALAGEAVPMRPEHSDENNGEGVEVECVGGEGAEGEDIALARHA